MRQWKWTVLAGLSVVVALCAPRAWAVKPGTLPPSQFPFETTVVTSNTASVGSFGTNDVLYGFRLIADDAGDVCGLYDTAALGTATETQGLFIDELVQDTDNRSQDSDWPAPYVLKTDLTVITNGICVVYHGEK